MAFNPTFFDRPSGPHPPGIRSVWLIPVREIEAFPYPALYDLLDEPLQLKANALVYQVLSLSDASTLRVDRQLEGIGRQLGWNVQINLPGNEADNELLSAAFVREPFVIITQDLSGMTMLLGTPGQPLRSQVLQSSAGESGARRIRITLRGQGETPAFLYEAPPPAAQVLNHIIGSNAPGLHQVTLIPAHRVVSIPLPDQDNVLPTGPDVLEGTESLTIPTMGLDASYTQSIQQDESGVYFGQQVNATVPDNLVSDTGMPATLKLYDHFVLLSTDLHGVQRLIGRPDEYLTASLQQSNDSKVNLSLRLQGETSQPSHRLLSPPVSVPEPPPAPIEEPLQDFREADFTRTDFY